VPIYPLLVQEFERREEPVLAIVNLHAIAQDDGAPLESSV
jgi:hypothetical protein